MNKKGYVYRDRVRQQYMQITENCDNHKKVINSDAKEGRN